uniref:Meiosis-specific nuclear structural protein 1 n=1 Tax=Polytomella parva TaxID=51329 RepID=A0A7S0YAH5_9CHLO|mmetsp:Transcript_13340/g.23615  ORF Transcript_13340/g.23615 Transcript_13340/m.23615 type:complete len:493 (+) Transcript_13340:115-1593(+)|eukprot:CAMPEP_0175053264 /NCGR_PEP_ID=MMETSP0052_2-20121109/8824_1 /TAXON_ID=51329 ORGANISM="Polytomella parva, Strain SAG 63-3" /NCGR_SAMPLE_ID=MMETSP0052_2 /ASSEMBLY_ACC=CAM_ASM_000194 /LENGTH=492 /DNA_ID=CAMNT_0016317771 /DNA_START=79 /DNA_END=1557 /DNA_ORIENTATION=+
MQAMWDDTKAPKRGHLARAVEQREQARRVKEAARSVIQNYFIDQKQVDAATENLSNDDFKRKAREFKERQAELKMLDSVYETERAKKLASIRSDEEQRITDALAKKQHEEDRKTLELQKLHDQRDELKDLAEKIRVARMNKVRAEQLSEKQQIQQQQRDYEEAFNKFREQNLAAEAARDSEFQARRREQNLKARTVLQDQIEEKKDMIRLAEQEHLRERALVDEIVRRIRDENDAETRLRHRKQEETKAYIEVFLREQEDAKRQQAETMRQEDRKIKEYWQMVSDREAQEASRKAERKEAADRMYEKIKKEMEEEARKKAEEEDLINLLHQEELELKRREEDAARKLKAERMKQEMIAANEYQKRLKAEREAARQKEEEEFRVMMMAKFAEDDRIEQMNAQKRRMRVLEHGREVQRLIDDKRRLFEEQRAKEEAELAAQKQEEERKQGLVEEERKKLLAELVELQDYLPRGVFRDKADVEYLTQLMGRGAAI